MKETTLSICYRTLAYDELSADDRQLVDEAVAATARSYVPYSHFRVGAAARLANGTVVVGSNQENAAYPSGTCAERTTLFYANSQYPDQPVTTLAVAARNERDEYLPMPISPCGACRQVMLETESRFGRPMRILLFGTQTVYELPSVSALLPFSFGAEALQ
ncbi:MAG: cytidine deaminase [Prevotellaceae bacterium]|jgi:cytidine deaminase|nr:cytidine deaminase [Prevotellaceae bacterium]